MRAICVPLLLRFPPELTPRRYWPDDCDPLKVHDCWREAGTVYLLTTNLFAN